MFKVYNKDNEIITIYSVQYKNGYPFFTFYKDGQWITKSAKNFKPVIKNI